MTLVYIFVTLVYIFGASVIVRKAVKEGMMAGYYILQVFTLINWIGNMNGYESSVLR